MSKYYQDINNAIRSMHYKYGIGDIKEIHRYADGKIEIIAQGYGMQPHTRRGNIVSIGNKHTIHIYRHQMTVRSV